MHVSATKIHHKFDTVDYQASYSYLSLVTLGVREHYLIRI